MVKAETSSVPQNFDNTNSQNNYCLNPCIITLRVAQNGTAIPHIVVENIGTALSSPSLSKKEYIGIDSFCTHLLSILDH